MGAHVVGVPVAAGGVVGDDDVGAHVVEHGAHGAAASARSAPAQARGWAAAGEPAIPESR